MITMLLDTWLGPKLAVSVPRYALLAAAGAQLVAVLAVLVWLAGLANAAGELVVGVVSAVASCAGRALGAIEGA